ncbi:hypothetical protein GR925_01355 [Streptomyces sp. HUCO-GS316]|uniref:hypothetical protein n=1 Tax=Streptomyces sp. HUCO-GS316 TaxID=2692198 RepID=UPI001370DBE9|nr:hypothetical protein [Streptomyces sp. HUCO-GS316]MXM62131.1 hypothetical protein [Streptomyces sp. HUCO-GS316]
MTFEWDLDYTAMKIDAAERSVTRKVTCDCQVTHPGTPEGKPGCGASWEARFYEDATGGHAAPPADPRLAAAARALETAGQDAESRLRTAAEKWVAGVAALLALFGIAGTVTGGTILDKTSEGGRESVVGLTLAAVAVAVVAVVFSYLAAYGWPKVIEMNDPKLLNWYEGRRNRLRTIARRLRWAVVAAVLSIGLLASAAAVAWLNASNSPDTTLKVTANDDSVTCGTLLAAKTPGTVRLRVADGTVKKVPLGTATKVESVRSC